MCDLITYHRPLTMNGTTSLTTAMTTTATNSDTRCMLGHDDRPIALRPATHTGRLVSCVSWTYMLAPRKRKLLRPPFSAFLRIAIP